MRFDCGETFEEEEARKKQWHRHFAWWPVKVADHDCRWLEFVERRGGFHGHWGGGDWYWEYRAVKP